MAFDFPNTPTVGQTFQGYTYDGEKWLYTLATPNTGGVIRILAFTASGTYTPSPNMVTCIIELVGGGGGGAGCLASGASPNITVGGGGGAGAYSRLYATAAMIGVSQTVTVGAGGAGGLAGNNTGGAGGITSVGSLCSAVGGAGGNPIGSALVSYVISGGAGGIGANGVGDVRLSGSAGNPGVGTGGVAQGGNGGPSVFGGAAQGLLSATGNAGLTGSGGAGAAQFSNGPALAGGAGGAGLVIITEYGITALGSAATTAGAVRFDLPQGLTANQQAQARSNTGTPNANSVINGDFRINQGGYVSAAVLAAGAYGHDQWKAGASGGDYSFTQLASSTQITIAAGKSLIQPIEDVRVVGGSYILTWTGTAQARAGVNSLTPSGAYAASPLLINGQTAGTVMSVEFNAGTLGTVKLEIGTIATPFVVPDYVNELLLCKRYWQKLGGTVLFDAMVNAGYAPSAMSVVGPVIHYGVEMRAAPTLTFVGTWTYTNASTINPFPGVRSAYFGLNATAAGAAYYYNAAGSYISLNARL